MVSTKGSVEIVTRLWLQEDKEGEDLDLTEIISLGIPCGSASLACIIRQPSLYEGAHDRVVQTVGGKAETVTKLALARLKAATRDVTGLYAPQVTHYMDVVISLAQSRNHPLRFALLHGNAISLFTNIAITGSRALQSQEDFILLQLVAKAFEFLNSHLEATDGFTWVTQSVKAGLLGALVDCSPFLSSMQPEGRTSVMRIIDKILPQYLVYRSVIEAVEGSTRILRLLEPSRKAKIRGSEAREGWECFMNLAQERHSVVVQVRANEAKSAACDNAEVSRPISIEAKDLISYSANGSMRRTRSENARHVRQPSTIQKNVRHELGKQEVIKLCVS